MRDSIRSLYLLISCHRNREANNKQIEVSKPIRDLIK